jgi:hypothetical protein
MKAAVVAGIVIGSLAAMSAVRLYLDHEEAQQKTALRQARIAEAKRRQAEANRPLTEEEAHEKRHAEQLAALEAAQAKEDAAAAQVRAEEACSQDVVCWSKPYLLDAKVRCESAVEKLAKWQYEWTDSIFGERKFLEPVWTDEGHKTFILAGHAIKMQNGFGAWRKVAYLCLYDPAQGRAEASAVE